MSKNIKVQRDGVTETFSGVKKIKTEHPSEGTVNWIPMDETELAIKTVNQNGTYKASSDGYYGYRQVVVATKGKGKTTGTKSDGRTYSVDTDEDGYLVETLLPDNIRINPQPTKTSYQNGETISLTGAVVKAYSKDDIWNGQGYSGGVIPHSELTLDPATASGGSGSGGRSYDEDIGIQQPILTTESFETEERLITQSGGVLGVYLSQSDVSQGLAVVATQIQNGATMVVEYKSSGSSYNYAMTDSFRHNEKTVYYNIINPHAGTGIVSGSYNNWTGNIADQAGKFAWTMVYGEMSGGGEETDKVTVKWQRPEDDEELTASFKITVS